MRWWWGLFYTRLTYLAGFILECHFTETTIHGYIGPLGHIILIPSQPSISLTFLLEYLRFFSIYIGLSDKLRLSTYMYLNSYNDSMNMMNLPLMPFFLIAIVFFVILRFITSDYSFGFFKLHYYHCIHIDNASGMGIQTKH